MKLSFPSCLNHALVISPIFFSQAEKFCIQKPAYFTFSFFGQDGVTEARFTFPVETISKQRKSMQQCFAKHWTCGNERQ